MTFKQWLLGFGDNSYHRTSPTLLLHRIRHRLTGRRRGCSCTKCFHHPKSPWAPIISERMAKFEAKHNCAEPYSCEDDRCWP